MFEQPLIFVTGKGGTGKTTVAAALATAAAAAGRRTLVCELAGGQQIAAAFGRPDPGGGEIRLAGRLWSLSLDPDVALEEWLRRQPGGAVVAAALARSRAFSHFVAAAPGAKELITVGKVVDMAGHAGDSSRSYDLVIADAASTGHALGMLGAPRSIADAVAIGPVAAQARRVGAFLADPDRTVYVGVALPEEMAVRETVELDQGLHEALGRGLDLVVVNGLYPDRLSDADADRLRALAERGRHEQLLGMVLAHHHRARAHAEQVHWLGRHTDAPLATLPFLFEHELGPGEYDALGVELTAQLRADLTSTPARQPSRTHRAPTTRSRAAA